MISDTENQDHQNSTSLVEHEIQLNSSSSSTSNSKVNDFKSKLNNFTDKDNQNDKPAQSINHNDNQVNGLIEDECNKVNNESNDRVINEVTIEVNDKPSEPSEPNESNESNKPNEPNKSNESSEPNQSNDNQPNNLDTETIDQNDSLIDKLELNLDYRKSADLNLLEQSTLSILSSNKSESNSLDAGSTNSRSNSRANSPCRSSQNSLPFPPKRINNESSTNLITSELDAKSYDEQLHFFKIERMNLFHLSSLILNNLINNISPLTKTLECHDNIVLYDFFSITEQILKHGLKARKGLIFGKKELWNVFESIENMNPQVTEIIQNIRELPNVKTNNGRVKAFLRLTFVHKMFNEIINYLISCKELLKSFYEVGSMILSPEIHEFLNRTEELKQFDFRWCPKDDRPPLDDLSNLINLTGYLLDKDRTTKEIIYKININKSQLNDLLEEKQFYEDKAKEFRNKILFYYNRIKELNIECLFEGDLVKNPTKLEMLMKKLNEFFNQPSSSVEKQEQNPDVLSLQEDIATLKKQLEIELSNRVSKEAALEYIEEDILVKQDENIVMRHQIEDVKQVNEELCAKVGELGIMNSDLNNKIVTLTNKNKQLVSSVTDLQKNLVVFEAKYNKLTTTERLLRKKFDELNELNGSLQKQLQKEQEEKNELQKKLDDNIEKNSNFLTELNLANNLSKDYPSLKKKHDILLRRCADYEQTMEELGSQLQAARLEIENLKEETVPLDAVWKDDKSISNCESCSTPFSTIVRRHHCRHCGSIYCRKCSDNKIPLPSDGKLSRVCDQCYTKLLHKYSAR